MLALRTRITFHREFHREDEIDQQYQALISTEVLNPSSKILLNHSRCWVAKYVVARSGVPFQAIKNLNASRTAYRAASGAARRPLTAQKWRGSNAAASLSPESDSDRERVHPEQPRFRHRLRLRPQI